MRRGLGGMAGKYAGELGQTWGQQFGSPMGQAVAGRVHAQPPPTAGVGAPAMGQGVGGGLFGAPPAALQEAAMQENARKSIGPQGMATQGAMGAAPGMSSMPAMGSAPAMPRQGIQPMPTDFDSSGA